MKQTLDLSLVADLPVRGPDHVALVEDNKANIVQERRVTAQAEVQFLRRSYYDLARAEDVLVEVACPHAAVEAGDTCSERTEGRLQDELGLRRQRTQRSYIHNSLSAP